MTEFGEAMLSGRHALISGGGSGIGAAIARRLAGQGAIITLVGRRAAPLAKLAAEIPGAVAVSGDVTDASSVKAHIRCGAYRIGDH